MAYQPDDKDLQILKELEQNGRVTNKELAEKVGLSPAPTLERVRKLEDNQFILSYHAVLSREKLGQHVRAAILVNLNNNLHSEIIKDILKIKGVESVTQVEGEADLLIDVATKDLASFAVIKNELTELPQIKKASTLFKLKKFK